MMNDKNGLSSLEILLSVSRELAASLDLHTVLERVLSLSTANMGAERASLIVLDSKGNPIDAAILGNGGMLPTTVERMQDVIESGLAGWVIRNRKLALVNDTTQDERWLPHPLSGQEAAIGKSALCIPIIAHEQLMGVLTIVQSSTYFFNEEQVSLQKAITEIASIAIYNAELYQDVENAHQRYYRLFEESIDPIFVTNLQGNILEANEQASHFTGFDHNALLKMNITDLHNPVLEKTGFLFERIPADRTVTYESSLQKGPDDASPIEVHVSQITISKNVDLQWIFKDIQEQKNANQLRDDLSAMLYHDLRSPLANIISSLDIMGGMLPLTESESLKSVFEVAKRSSERMQRMIDGLLDINRLESGQQIVNKQIVVVNDVIMEAVDGIKATAHNKEIVILPELLKTSLKITVDADMIRRVLINLIENAIKFSPNGSTVRVGTKVKEENVEIWVDDEGSGIPENTKEKIFEKFIRLKQNYPTKGMGLGLAFCKLAVRAHGGTIWVENIPQGGSRFIFTVPLHPQY
jgi:PAS domain S-box-containing protein